MNIFLKSGSQLQELPQRWDLGDEQQIEFKSPNDRIQISFRQVFDTPTKSQKKEGKPLVTSQICITTLNSSDHREFNTNSPGEKIDFYLVRKTNNQKYRIPLLVADVANAIGSSSAIQATLADTTISHNVGTNQQTKSNKGLQRVKDASPDRRMNVLLEILG